MPKHTIKLRSNKVLSGLANFLGRPLIGKAGVRIWAFVLPYPILVLLPSPSTLVRHLLRI